MVIIIVSPRMSRSYSLEPVTVVCNVPGRIKVADGIRVLISSLQMWKSEKRQGVGVGDAT